MHQDTLKNLGLVAIFAAGVGYAVHKWDKSKVGTDAAYGKSGKTPGTLNPGDMFTAKLMTGTYTIDPSLISPPTDIPNGTVQLQLIAKELGTSGQVTRIHGLYTPPSGIKVALAFDPTQVVSIP